MEPNPDPLGRSANTFVRTARCCSNRAPQLASSPQAVRRRGRNTDGLRHFTARLAMSPTMLSSFITKISPGNGTAPNPALHTEECRRLE